MQRSQKLLFSALPLLLVAFGSGQTPDASSSATTSTTAPTPATVSMKTGALNIMPKTCSASSSVYVASDQPQGQQIYVCGADGNYYQFISLGGSGALQITNGALDITPSVIPTKMGANTWNGLQVFINMRLASGSTLPCADAQRDGGNLRLNTTNAQNWHTEVCLVRRGTLQWLPMDAPGTPWGVPVTINPVTPDGPPQ